MLVPGIPHSFVVILFHLPIPHEIGTRTLQRWRPCLPDQSQQRGLGDRRNHALERLVRGLSRQPLGQRSILPTPIAPPC